MVERQQKVCLYATIEQHPREQRAASGERTVPVFVEEVVRALLELEQCGGSRRG